MATVDPVELLLRQLSDLLSKNGEPTWAEAFEGFANQYKEAPEATKANIRSLFGGMGSFNDFVLYDTSGIPPRSENEDLDQLRSQLYALCRG